MSLPERTPRRANARGNQYLAPRQGARGLFLLACFLVCLAQAGTAAAKKDTEYTFDEQTSTLKITITANKREEDLQETPASVTALPARELEQSGLRDTTDLNSFIPNFRFWEFGSQGGIGVLSLRGLANRNQSDPAVTLYIDDVPQSDQRSFYHPLYDVERIEVLRGPQGTLFGKDSEAGVVNIITKKPGNVWEGNVNLEAGNFSSHAVRAGISGPLAEDKLFIGLSGVFDGRDGFLDNLYNGDKLGGQQTFSGQGKLRWTPTPELDVQLTVSGEKLGGNGGLLYTPMDKGLYQATWMPKFYGALGLPTPPVGFGPFQVFQDYDGSSRSDSDRQSLRVDYAGPWCNIVSITTRRDQLTAYANDADGTGLDFETYHLGSSVSEWSQELRFVSPQHSGPFSWIAGAFFDSRQERVREWYGMGADYPAVFYGLLPAPVEYVQSDARLRDATWAGFGQASYRFFDEKFGLTAGLRYEYITKDMDRAPYFQIGGALLPVQLGYPLVFGSPMPQSGVASDSAGFDQWLPKFGLDYRFTPDIMGFVSVAKGYRAGGFDFRSLDPSLVRYRPETNWTYEAGLKTTWLGDRLRLNVAGFYSQIKDYQDVVAYNVYTSSLRNVGSATITGFEAEAKFSPVKQLELTGTLGLLDARYHGYTDPATGQNYDGKFFVLTPNYNFSLAAQYAFDCGLTLRAEMAGYGAAYTDQANTMQLDPYALFNARIGYKMGNYEFYAFGKNLANREYFVYGANNIGIVGQARTFGLGMTYRF